MRQRNEWGGKTPYNQTKTPRPEVTLQDLLGYQFARYDALRKHAIVLIDIDGNTYGPIGPYRKDEAEHLVLEYGTNRWCQDTNRWVTNPDRIGAKPVGSWVDYRIVEAPQAGFHDGIGWDPEWVEAKHAGWQMVQEKWNEMAFVDESEADKWMRCDGNVYTVFWGCVIEYLETQLAARAAVWKLHSDYNADESELRSGIVRMVLANTRGRPMYRDMGVELREAKLALVECHKMLGQIRRRLDAAYAARFPTDDTGGE